MRGRFLVCLVAAVVGVSACGGGSSRGPASPSSAIVATVGGGSGPAGAAPSTVTWSCFARADAAGTFGASGCAAGATTSRLLPAAASPITAPGAPTGLTATVSGSTVTLNWTAPSGGDAPTSYVIQAGSGTGLTDIASFDTGTSATSIAVLNVPAATYFVRVRAANSAGLSAASNEFQLVVAGAAPCGALSPPTGFSASVTGDTVVLSWSAPGGCAPTNYVVQVGSAPGLSNLATFSTGSTATTFRATGVAAGTYYARIVSAANGVVSAASTEILFVVGGCGTAPNAPTNLRATVSGSTVSLVWDAPTGACPATAYLLQAGSTAGATNLANSAVVGTSLTATGVANGTYYVRVKAANAIGQSAASNEIIVTVGTPAPTPTNLIVSFQFFDPATQTGATDTCKITSSSTTSPSTCQVRSTSFATGTNTIVTYEWTVQYTYGTAKTITQTGTAPILSFSDTCGGPQSTTEGFAQPLAVTLTVIDNLGARATATSGSGSQPPLQLRLFKC